MIVDARVLNELLDRLSRLESNSVQRFYAVVTDTTPLKIRVGSSDFEVENVAWVSTYTPVADDRVIVLRAGQDWIVLGETTS